MASIETVPGELRKNMQAIRSYDVKQQALHAQLQAEQAGFVAEAKRRTDAGEEVDDEALQALKEQYRTVLALCDKKVGPREGAQPDRGGAAQTQGLARHRRGGAAAHVRGGRRGLSAFGPKARAGEAARNAALVL